MPISTPMRNRFLATNHQPPTTHYPPSPSTPSNSPHPHAYPPTSASPGTPDDFQTAHRSQYAETLAARFFPAQFPRADPLSTQAPLSNHSNEIPGFAPRQTAHPLPQSPHPTPSRCE